MDFRHYEVNAASVSFSHGQRLALDNAQAKVRAHQIKLVEKIGDEGGIYEVTGRVEFKRGEHIGVAGKIEKATQIGLIDHDAQDEGDGLVGGQDGDGNVVDLESMKKPQLVKMAEDAGIEGASEMTKAQLVHAIKAADGGPAGE